MKPKQIVEEYRNLKEFCKFSKENQDILLKKWPEIKDLSAFSKMHFNKKDQKFLLDDSYIIISSFGIGISTDNKNFQMTDHTLYTLLDECKVSPSDFQNMKVTSCKG